MELVQTILGLSLNTSFRDCILYVSEINIIPGKKNNLAEYSDI